METLKYNVSPYEVRKGSYKSKLKVDMAHSNIHP